MRRSTLLSAVQGVIQCLVASDIQQTLYDTIDASHRGDPGERNHKALESLRDFSTYYATCSDAEVEVFNILRLNQLTDPKIWNGFFTQDNADDRINLHGIFSNIRFAESTLPLLLDLIKQDRVDLFKGEISSRPKEYQDKELLSVIVVEEGERFSNPKRLTQVLESISSLYSVCAELDGNAGDDIVVLACDSGSDKSFDFLGAAKAMKEVKDIIISVWDRKVFHRQKEASESLKLIGESLPILERIHGLEQSGALAPEAAELLKRKAITGATQFLEAGATIPELEAESTHEPRQLLKPEQKLLGAFLAVEEVTLPEVAEHETKKIECETPDSEETGKTDTGNLIETLKNLTLEERDAIVSALSQGKSQEGV